MIIDDIVVFHLTWSKWACNLTSHTIAIKISHGSDYRCVLSVKKKEVISRKPTQPRLTADDHVVSWLFNASLVLWPHSDACSSNNLFQYHCLRAKRYFFAASNTDTAFKKHSCCCWRPASPCGSPALPGTTAITSVFACYCSNFPATEQQTTWNSRVTH